MEIPSPETPPGNPDRDFECSIHMGCVIVAIWECFEDAGWTEEEFDRALIAGAKRYASSEEPA